MWQENRSVPNLPVKNEKVREFEIENLANFFKAVKKYFSKEKELIVDNLKMSNNMPSLISWVIENLQESNNSEYVDLIEKKKKMKLM